VHYLPDKKNNFGSLSNCHYCTDHAQNMPGPVPNIWLTLFQVSSKSVHFWWSYSRMREGLFCPIEYLYHRLCEPMKHFFKGFSLLVILQAFVYCSNHTYSSSTAPMNLILFQVNLVFSFPFVQIKLNLFTRSLHQATKSSLGFSSFPFHAHEPSSWSALSLCSTLTRWSQTCNSISGGSI